MIANIDILVKELIKLPKEIGWVEFKHNNSDPTMIGEDLSALANTATLNDRDYAYMIWGVEDGTHEVLGTTVRLQLQKKGEQELENWLRYLLSKNADFEFLDTEIDGKHIEYCYATSIDCQLHSTKKGIAKAEVQTGNPE